MIELHLLSGEPIYIMANAILIILGRHDENGRPVSGSRIVTSVKDEVLVVREDPKTVLAEWQDAD